MYIIQRVKSKLILLTMKFAILFKLFVRMFKTG
jgi:hypothetical protein